MSPLFSPKKLTTFFCSSLSLLLISLGCHPLPCRVSPRTFLSARPRLSTILCKFAHKNFVSFGCHPLEGVTRGGPPHLCPSPGDGTDTAVSSNDYYSCPYTNFSHNVFIFFYVPVFLCLLSLLFFCIFFLYHVYFEVVLLGY